MDLGSYAKNITIFARKDKCMLVTLGGKKIGI